MAKTMPIDLSALSTAELLQTYAGVMRELRDRGVVRSANNPVSDIAEFLCAKAFNLTLSDKSARGCDGIDPAGLRYQIKSRRITPDNDSTQLGVIRDIDECQFDYLVALYFNEYFELTAAYRLPHDAVKQHALWSKAQAGHILHAKQAVVRDSRCERVMDRFVGIGLPVPRSDMRTS